MSEPNLDILFDLAVTAARAAGEKLRHGASNLRHVTFQDAKDVKLQADQECEQLIRRLFAEKGNLPVIGEEEGGDAAWLERNELYWIVDPLDGTSNYLRYNPGCCVSIGLWRGSEPILGVIYDFNRDELFTGGADRALTLNQQPVTPQWVNDMRQAVLFTGFPEKFDFSDERLKAFIADTQRFKKIRMIGTSALALAYVAVGRGDVYFEKPIKLWDVAAGLALIKAAGGAFRRLPIAGKTLAFEIWAGPNIKWLQHDPLPQSLHRRDRD